MDAPLAQEIAVGGVALGDGRHRVGMGPTGLPGRAGHDAAGSRMGAFSRDAVRVGGGHDLAAQDERNACGVSVVARLDGDGVAGVADRGVLCTRRRGLDRHRRMAVRRAVRVARPRPPDERDGPAALEVTRLGAHPVGIGVVVTAVLDHADRIHRAPPESPH